MWLSATLRVFVADLRAEAPRGAGFESPGRSRPGRRSPGYAENRERKAQRAEIPGVRWCNARNGISPRWGFLSRHPAPTCRLNGPDTFAVIPVDSLPRFSDNPMMNTATIPTAEEDVQVVTDAFLSGRPIPADVANRIEERAAALRQQIFQKHGYLNIAVSSVRESRETGH